MRQNETQAEREHRYDREVIVADYRWRRAKAGKGYRFIAPPPVPKPETRDEGGTRWSN